MQRWNVARVVSMMYLLMKLADNRIGYIYDTAWYLLSPFPVLLHGLGAGLGGLDCVRVVFNPDLRCLSKHMKYLQ